MWEAVKERCDHAEKLDQNHIRAFPNVSVRLKEGALYTSHFKGPPIVNGDTSISLTSRGSVQIVQEYLTVLLVFTHSNN